MDPRRRFEEFAARVGEARSTGSQRRPGVHALKEGYWAELRELFTRDITSKEWAAFVINDTRESFRYFVREVDFEAIRARPWYRRYPLMAWRVFQAMAYRLNPARRLVFAIGSLILAAGWLAVLTVASMGPPFVYMVMGSTLLFVILLLELRDKLALKGDLEIARQIQFGLLPFEPWDQGRVAIRSAMRPANTVGGDYFDIVDLGQGRLAVMVGDVSGKGMPAALLMALLQGSLRTLLTAGLRGADMIAKLNVHLCAHIPSNRLVTLFYGELDAGATTLRYVNAGHNPPFVVRSDGTLERLAPTAMALGIQAEAPYAAMETPLDPGDRLLFYTDGITEANDIYDVEYGDERLAAFLSRSRAASDQELLDGLLADVLRYCGPVRPHDDMTLMVVARRA